MTQTAWPDEREEQLRRWWTKYSAGIIADKFAAEGFVVSRSAVCGKANRIGLSGPQTKVPLENLWNRRPGPRPKRKSPVKVSANVALAGPPTVAFREPRVYGFGSGPLGCAWIEGDVREPGWFYCNAPKANGWSYCAGHAVMCYRPDPRSCQPEIRFP